jgi:cytochrome c peroxidase
MNLRQDVGHYVVTKEKADIGKFLTPSLWDIGQTAPYTHNGVFGTLEEVVAFYDAGGGRDSGLQALGLSESEKADLVAFLKSMTGKAPTEKAPELPEYQLRKVGVN